MFYDRARKNIYQTLDSGCVFFLKSLCIIKPPKIQAVAVLAGRKQKKI
jgi:hypothetical protein